MARLTREQSREITRERLRSAAIGEIAIAGFTGASIDRICEAAGFTRGAFYANFRSKEDLLLDVMRCHHDRETERWIALIEAETNLADLLPRLRVRFAEYLADREHILFTSEVLLYARRNDTFLASYQEELVAFTLRAERVLEAVFRKARKIPHRPLAEVANLVRGLFIGIALDMGAIGDRVGHSADLLLMLLEDMLSLAANVAESADRPAG